MIQLASELREKDVIDITSGKRLGFVCDFSVDTDCGAVCAIFVSDRILSLGKSGGALRIPWEKIACIGADTVLVKMEKGCPPPCPDGCGKPHKRGFFFGG